VQLDRRWEALYDECRSDLYRVAVYLLGASEAEEVVQDAFERAMREQDFFDRVQAPAAWLRTVTVRLSVSRLRRRAMLERIHLRAPERANGLPDPELYDALRSLPPLQRGAIVLRYFFGSDYAEIARALGMSEKSIGATLTRARTALKKELS
jgi:RNA polymerase sigma-70 factor (ECF subfamily)